MDPKWKREKESLQKEERKKKNREEKKTMKTLMNLRSG